MLGKLLNKMPNLLSLTAPSAPNFLFFEGESHSLTHLRVEAGYSHENFILNLSRSSRFLNLRHLDFGEYNEQYSDLWPQNCTPFEHYVSLFQSNDFLTLSTFTLRNSVMTQKQIQELQLLNKNVEFSPINSCAY